MKKRVMALAGVVAVCMLLAIVSNVTAADANSPKGTPKEKPKGNNPPITGIVTVVKDNDGNIIEIKVKVRRELIYQVVLDEKGKELGNTMADKRVKIEGTVEIKGDVHLLTVKTFGEVKAKPEAKPKPKPPADKPRQNQ
jgi:hypothetical protein